ncbi:hypothetical protein CN895_07920 [Bacillus cereus]|uniref:hypothetical protein n=1 Tax=Bacillus cereus TaxID=1396 RepID=UPI000BFB9C30|nr:hypothetical protein [Bacillus cereus]PGK15267.1 hypothetical protein CN895_07920 [Bacillus cereus]
MLFPEQFSFYQLEIKNTCPQQGVTNSTIATFMGYGSAGCKAHFTIQDFLKINNENDLTIIHNEDRNNEIYPYTWSGIHKHTFEKLEITITCKQFADAEDHYRICTHCNEIMFEGYCIDEGCHYFCSDECLHTKYTPEEYQKAYEEDWAYWTDWH